MRCFISPQFKGQSKGLVSNFGCKGTNFYLSMQIFFEKKQLALHKPPPCVQFFGGFEKRRSFFLCIFEYLLYLHDVGKYEGKTFVRMIINQNSRLCQTRKSTTKCLIKLLVTITSPMMWIHPYATHTIETL